jgi:high-affinity iron transporter
MRWFFTATSLLVLLLAAGMASQAAHYLIQADLIPALISPMWDTSAMLSEKSIPGMLLHSLIGYDAHPTGMQLLFYVVTLTAIAAGMKWINYRPTENKLETIV